MTTIMSSALVRLVLSLLAAVLHIHKGLEGMALEIERHSAFAGTRASLETLAQRHLLVEERTLSPIVWVQ